MINNTATYLLLQSTQNNMHPHYGAPLFNIFVGIPLILALLFMTIGLVLNVVFEWKNAIDYMIKIVSILILVAVIGFIVAIFVTFPLHI
jgi:hypothetical protein